MAYKLGNTELVEIKRKGEKPIHIRVRSLWEHDVVKYYQFLKEEGMVKDWHFEPKYIRLPLPNGKSINYLPDLVIENIDGTFFLLEVKGKWDKASKTKIKATLKNRALVGSVFKKYGALPVGRHEHIECVGIVEYMRMRIGRGGKLNMRGGFSNKYMRNCDSWENIKRRMIKEL